MVAEVAAPRHTAPGGGVGQPPVRLEIVAGLLTGLNREQRNAVTHGDGPQMVIAGPGTGKTEVVTRRVAWLIATRRAKPRQILALTFTDNAADEMQARVDLLVPYGQADTAIHTFHAFGDRLLREHAFELGLPGDVRLINRAESIVLLRENLFALGLERYRPLGNPARFLGALVDLFGRAKDEGVGPERLVDYAARFAAAAENEAEHDAARALAEQAAAYGAYQRLLAEHGLIDHGDQLALPLRLLRERPAVRAEVVDRFRYLLVDEFQDMNRAQLELVIELSSAHHNVTVVGDLDQAIYTFRGAAGDNFGRFSAAHSELRRVVLRRNYRSHRPIIDAARRLIAHGRRWHASADERAVAVRRARQPAPVRLVSYSTPGEEADGVAAEIARRVAAGAPPSDFCVLARSNAEIEPLVRSLAVRGLPVRSHSPADFFAQPHVRPLVALLRFAADPTQTLELYVLATAWPYQLGGEALTQLLADARRANQPLWQVVCRLADEAADRPQRDSFTAAARRLVEDLRAVIESAHHRTSGELLYDQLRRSGRLAWLAGEGDPAEVRAVARFFDLIRARAGLLADGRAASLVPHLDALIEAEDDAATEVGPLDDNAVSVLTIHRAKGLEFRIVYLTGLSDGRFPALNRPPALAVPWHELHGETATDDERLNEERRLCYVAMTRARDELWLSTHLSGPAGRGRRRPSPFIAEALDLPIDKTPATPDRLGQVTALGIIERAPTPPVVPSSPGAFSFSQLGDYLDCPERYRLRHVVGLPTPAHHALSYGRALHAAVAYFHLQTARGAPPTDEALGDEFRRAWSPEGFLSREHEEARFAAGQRALAQFRIQQLAQPAPVAAVERPFEFELAGVRIRGRMDRLDRDDAGAVIVDYKSSDVRDQRRADEKARESLQLQVYALAHEAQSGVLPHAMRLHYLDSGLVGETTPDQARLERARTQVSAAVAGIAAQSFPAKPNPVACGYCPFRQLCVHSAA